MDCARAIDKAIADCYNGNYIYELESAVKSVISDYGVERTKFVVAVHLQRANYDGRYSQANKTWANTLAIMHLEEFKHIYMNAHATVLDGFTDYLRKIAESQQKPKVGSYGVKKSVLFSDNQGIAYGESKSLVAPYVTWQFRLDIESGERKYFSSRYYAYKDSAIDDYKHRIESYKASNKVEEIKAVRTKNECTS